jgi:hypothetical protein
VAEVNTVSSSSIAGVTIQAAEGKFDPCTPTFDFSFDIPIGLQGPQGPQGESNTENAHSSVRVATTTALNNSPTYTAGSADASSGTGVGAYIQATTNGALSIDGVAVAVGDRVLVKNQADQRNNGIYTVTTTGGVSALYKLTRATDYDNHLAAQVEYGDYVFIVEGTVNNGDSALQNNVGSNVDGSIRIGTDNITFTVVGGIGPQGPTGATGAGGALGYYGSFFSDVNQTAASTNTAYAMTFDNTPDANGVSIVSNSRITMANVGTYDLQFSAQLYYSGGGGAGETVQIWFRINGTDVAASATKVTVKSNNPYAVAAWDYLFTTTAANDYIEIMWSTDNTNIQLLKDRAARKSRCARCARQSRG